MKDDTAEKSAREEIDDLIDLRDGLLEEGLSEEAARIDDSILAAITDAYFTGELDLPQPDDPEDTDPPGASGPEGENPK